MKQLGVNVEDESMKGMRKRIRRTIKETSHRTDLHDGEIVVNKEAPQTIFNEATKALHQASAASYTSITFQAGMAPAPMNDKDRD